MVHRKIRKSRFPRDTLYTTAPKAKNQRKRKFTPTKEGVKTRMELIKQPPSIYLIYPVIYNMNVQNM